jgi:hypothetical protein
MIFPTSHIYVRFFHKYGIFLFVKNESYQTFKNICKPNLAYFTSIQQTMAQNDCKKLALPENIGRLLQICQRHKLQIFVNQFLVTFGRKGTCQVPPDREVRPRIFVLSLHPPFS